MHIASPRPAVSPSYLQTSVETTPAWIYYPTQESWSSTGRVTQALSNDTQD